MVNCQLRPKIPFTYELRPGLERKMQFDLRFNCNKSNDLRVVSREVGELRLKGKGLKENLKK